jgi:hypothetical protein
VPHVGVSFLGVSWGRTLHIPELGTRDSCKFSLIMFDWFLNVCELACATYHNGQLPVHSQREETLDFRF